MVCSYWWSLSSSRSQLLGLVLQLRHQLVHIWALPELCLEAPDLGFQALVLRLEPARLLQRRRHRGLGSPAGHASAALPCPPKACSDGERGLSCMPLPWAYTPCAGGHCTAAASSMLCFHVLALPLASFSLWPSSTLSSCACCSSCLSLCSTCGRAAHEWAAKAGGDLQHRQAGQTAASGLTPVLLPTSFMNFSSCSSSSPVRVCRAAICAQAAGQPGLSSGSNHLQVPTLDLWPSLMQEFCCWFRRSSSSWWSLHLTFRLLILHALSFNGWQVHPGCAETESPSTHRLCSFWISVRAWLRAGRQRQRQLHR